MVDDKDRPTAPGTGDRRRRDGGPTLTGDEHAPGDGASSGASGRGSQGVDGQRGRSAGTTKGKHGRPHAFSDQHRRLSKGAALRGAPPNGDGRVWLFGLHAVRDALLNPRRRLHRILLTPNARQRLMEGQGNGDAHPDALLAPHETLIEIADPRRFPAPLDPGSVHQGAAIETEALDWGGIDTLVNRASEVPSPLALALDRVTDPHNVGAVLRSAEVFGAAAVIAPRRHSAPETGALAKAASGALERQPYLRPVNLGDSIAKLAQAGFVTIGLDGAGDTDLADAMASTAGRPRLIVLGAEGPGLRARTRDLCDIIAKVPSAGSFASLNVSNAAAVALYAAATTRGP
ncbi:MAG: RNA methyltransferase [Pseudomonadota bacterium]